MTKNVLHIDASSRYEDSFTRKFSQSIVNKIGAANVTYRDLAQGVPIINEAWVKARFTPADQLGDAGKATLEYSDELITELQNADTIVIGSPIYNFNIAASLKLWIDQIVRPGATVGYDADGNAMGLLKDKKVIIAIASAGVGPNSPVDFVSDYLKFVFGYIGITDVQLLWGDRAMFRGEEVFTHIDEQLQAMAL